MNSDIKEPIILAGDIFVTREVNLSINIPYLNLSFQNFMKEVRNKFQIISQDIYLQEKTKINYLNSLAK